MALRLRSGYSDLRYASTPWHDKPKQQRSRLAASVAFGAGTGLAALGLYLTHAGSWEVWPVVVLAVLFPVQEVM